MERVFKAEADFGHKKGPDGPGAALIRDGTDDYVWRLSIGRRGVLRPTRGMPERRLGERAMIAEG